MQDLLNVTGMIIHQDPIGEYDRRIVILTKNNGKISAFAKGARRPNSKFVASTDLFCFGDFRLFVGKESYTVQEACISNYFASIRNDLSNSLYGMYFLEVSEYNTRENNDEYNILRLLYSSVKALDNKEIPNNLIKIIFELKFYTLMGQFVIDDYFRKKYQPSTVYTLDFIYNTKPEKLYSFKVSELVMKELLEIAEDSKRKLMPHTFNSEEMLSVLG